jgi:hypothetical protein
VRPLVRLRGLSSARPSITDLPVLPRGRRRTLVLFGFPGEATAGANPHPTQPSGSDARAVTGRSVYSLTR